MFQRIYHFFIKETFILTKFEMLRCLNICSERHVVFVSHCYSIYYNISILKTQIYYLTILCHFIIHIPLNMSCDIW